MKKTIFSLVFLFSLSALAAKSTGDGPGNSNDPQAEFACEVLNLLQSDIPQEKVLAKATLSARNNSGTKPNTAKEMSDSQINLKYELVDGSQTISIAINLLKFDEPEYGLLVDTRIMNEKETSILAYSSARYDLETKRIELDMSSMRPFYMLSLSCTKIIDLP